MTLGWNYTLKDKKLFIFKHQWLESIIKFNKEVDDEIKKLEPGIWLDIKEQNSVFKSARPHLLALVDEVRTELQRERNEQTKKIDDCKVIQIPDEHLSIAA